MARTIPRAAAALALAALVGASACASTPEPATRAEAARAGQVVVYEVFGMDCPGCHGGLEKLVRRVPGVLEATASWQQQRLTLVLAEDAAVPDAALRDAIARANFTAGERLR